ncbi:hypothetical protein [Teredinibacter sp. KSP-S5-2]|uniref:hypothetical protein n=1 Tax=Teredinibacter sp. KSP-S5-2 TaxID=3034506 RepID=UPI00293512A5|nr:hypothetical protein [Teredinibacter sp. KSP-S5-2]WNO10560.1 hypothetical protein P5V12_05175 [Teredinibacter sp. KSP-S5-2]
MSDKHFTVYEIHHKNLEGDDIAMLTEIVRSKIELGEVNHFTDFTVLIDFELAVPDMDNPKYSLNIFTGWEEDFMRYCWTARLKNIDSKLEERAFEMICSLG